MDDVVHVDELDDDDSGSPAAKPLWSRWWFTLVVVAVLALGIAVAFETPGVTTFFAVLLGVVIFRSGLFFLRSFATPLPPPPDPGTLRKVKLVYRCPVCGTEVRMTAATTEEPEPPRHCMDEMELVSPIE